MKPKFKINRLGAQDRSPTYDSFLTKEILDDICYRICNTNDYDVVWVEKRNKGRLITLETDNIINYINLSQTGQIKGRNYQVQSIPTALSIFLNEEANNKKSSLFWFYFLPFEGDNETKYMLFFYRVMMTVGIKFLNSDFGLEHTQLIPYASVKDMIYARNHLREANSGNQSTYITDEGDYYHIYGKTFGANQKETTLLCFAISAITDKPVKLFQIVDNESTEISEQDKEAISKYSKTHGNKTIEILDDSYQFDNDTSDHVRDNLRSPQFIYNLLSKFGGEKKCVLCECKIDRIIQAAHIYPVAAIRRRDDLDFDNKLRLAVDADNGIWLCENHHKLFDSGLIWFDEGQLVISNKLNQEDLMFIKQVTTIEQIEPRYINERMLAFFDSRAGIPSRVVL